RATLTSTATPTTAETTSAPTTAETANTPIVNAPPVTSEIEAPEPAPTKAQIETRADPKPAPPHGGGPRVQIPQPTNSAKTLPTVTAQPPPKKNCDPPFVMDPATGRKKYKLECL